MARLELSNILGVLAYIEKRMTANDDDPTRRAGILERIVRLRADISRLDISWNEHPESRRELFDLEIRCFELSNQYLRSARIRVYQLH